MPFINDPTPIGWITLAMYITDAGLCAAAWMRARHARGATVSPSNTSGAGHAAGEIRFWAALSILLILLGINKQLDVQTALTETAKSLAQAQGWYEQRAAVQVAFTVVACVAIGLLLCVLVRFTWGAWNRHLLSLLGVVLIFAYVIVRLINIEGVDERLGVDLSLVEDLWAVEWAGLVCVGLSAARRHATA